MIYTFYFANLKKLPKNIVPISICGKAPEWYTGLQYKKLAPKYDFFMKWKENHDNDFYIEHFNKEVLDLLDSKKVIEDLTKLSNNQDIALICYEKPGDFCHRHLVAEWLTKNGYNCTEYSESLITEEHIDLFKVEGYVYAHCISSDFVMGGGIALLFTQKGVKQKLLDNYPQAWNGVGYGIPVFMKNHIVYNLVTKEKVYYKPTYETLKQSLESLREWILQAYKCGQVPYLKIAMPLIGCGLDMLEWDKVKPIIEEVFNNTGIEIKICIWP